MADSVISALPAVGNLTQADLIPIVQAGVTSKATAGQLASLANTLATAAATTAVATGTGDALLATFNPAVAALVNGAQYTIRAPGSNTVPIPTLALGALAAKPIVKGSNVPLQAGDISGNRHWLEVVYDSTLDKFVLGNPVYPAVAYGDMQVASLNSGPLAGFRNRLINPRFTHWQRGLTINCPTGLTYCADRWIMGVAGASPITASYASFGSGALAYPCDSTAMILVIPAGSAFSNLRQRIESVTSFQGQTVTVSFWAKVIAGATNIAVILTQSFGTGGAPSADVQTILTPNGGVALGAQYALYSYTGTLPAITGKTFGTAGNDYLEVQLQTSSAAAHTIGIAAVQAEQGPATPLEARPVGVELALCQRYFQWLPPVTGRWQGATTLLNIATAYPVAMRAAPTATVVGSITVEEYGVAFRNITGATISSNVSGYYGTLTTVAATNSNSGGVPFSGPGGGIALSAEL